MQNPLLEQQVAIIQRIVSNAVRKTHSRECAQLKTTAQEKLNEAMAETNRALGEIVDHNRQLEVIADLWAHYNRNVRFNLENQGQLEKPR